MGQSVAYRIDRALGITHIRAHFRRHRFTPHAHDDYLVGLTTDGAEHLRQDGRAWVSRPGQVRAINPGEVHDGGTEADAPWGYDAIYVPPALLGEASLAIGGTGAAPTLTLAVMDAPRLAAAFRALLEELDGGDRLAREVALATLLALLVASPSAGGTPSVLPAAEPNALGRVRDVLHAHVGATVTLDALAAASGLSKFHMLRAFKARTGLTPAQFHMQLRLDRARELLARGEPPGQVAAACGFVDQSHLTRRFRRVLGVTPGAYAAAVRGTEAR